MGRGHPWGGGEGGGSGSEVQQGLAGSGGLVGSAGGGLPPHTPQDQGLFLTSTTSLPPDNQPTPQQTYPTPILPAPLPTRTYLISSQHWGKFIKLAPGGACRVGVWWIGGRLSIWGGARRGIKNSLVQQWGEGKVQPPRAKASSWAFPALGTVQNFS